ncbi:hypothetical protein HBI78_243480 [Parastagonospora nodorum]|nr:hypothetical protein HBI78_243480 [Parastagonospora nodorum]
MIKFCWTKACPLCGAALKSKHSPRIEAQALYTSRCNSFLSLFCLLTRFATSLLSQQRQQSNDYTRSLTVFYSRREAIMAGQWYKSKANTISSNSMSQTNVREGYRITTLEVVELVEDLTSYVKKKDLLEKIQLEKSQSQLLKSLRSLTSKDWLAVAKCTQLRNAQIPKVFYEAAAGTIWMMMLAKVRQYGAKVKTEDLSNTPTPTLSETAQRRSSSVVSNRSTASITDKFGVASLTEPAILNDANVALVDAVHHSVVIDALMMTLIEDDDDLLGTVNSYIKLRRLRAVMLLLTFQPNELSEQPSPPEQPLLPKKRADSRYAKASGGRTKKDKDSEDSDTSSDVLRLRRRDRAAARARLAERKRLGKEAQLKKTRDEEELAKAKKEKEEKEAQERETYSSDINSKDDSKDEEATTAKDLAREQKERLKALLNAKTRDGLSARVETAIEHCTLEEWTLAAVFFGVSIDDLQNKRTIKLPACWGVSCDFTLYQLTDAYILYFKELLSDNSGIFANAIGMGKTRAMVLAVLIEHVHFKNWTEVQNARAEGNAIEHNAVDDDDKLCPTEGERTFYCACERSLSFNAEPRQAAIIMTIAIDLANSTWCDLSDPLALRFCFFSDSPLENMGRLTKEEAMEMRIDTTDAISKALAAANKLVALQSYVLGGVDYRETVYWIIPEANTPAVHSEATKHCLAPSAARFVIVCGFGKVDKHVFRAYNTISVTAQRTIIRKGGPYIEKRAILLPGHVTVWGRTVFDEFHNCKLEGTIIAKDSVTGDRIYKIEDAVYRSIRNMIANVKHDASKHKSSYEYKELISQGAAVAQRFMLKRILKTRDPCLCLDFLSTVQNAEQQCRDILEKEGLDELEASRPFYSALATLKAAQFKTYGSCKVKRFTSNSVKDLFTNSSKDYFLFQNLSNLCSEVEILGTPSRTWSIAAEDAAKAANTLLLLKEVRAKILIGSYKPIVQAVTWLGLREKFGDESVLRDPDRPWIMVASMAFAEAIILTEATHVVIMEPQDRQNTQNQFIIVYFNPDSELELKVLGKQDVKTTSRDKLQGGGSTVTDQRMDWHQTEPIVMSLEALC